MKNHQGWSGITEGILTIHIGTSMLGAVLHATNLLIAHLKNKKQLSEVEDRLLKDLEAFTITIDPFVSQKQGDPEQ
uniref:Uncharacterized protein n=1 Tax=Thermosporothrix sp. COM3 TaxID=2490863 RepID=A0A455SE05_9CHLR|nr:hypothetical protein KTC_02920 [Thermosporothrix sp. COM3]